MQDLSQENNFPNEPAGQNSGNNRESPEQDHNHHHHHHHHRHRHKIKMHRSGSSVHRIEDRSKRKGERRSESLFARTFLRIAGIVFIVAAIWFTISSIGPLKDTFRSVVSRDFFQVTERHHIPVVPGNETTGSKQPSVPVVSATPVKSNILIMAGAILLLVLLIVSLITRKTEIAVFSLVYWIFFGGAWMIRTVLSGDNLLLNGYLGYSSVIYILFFIFNILKPLTDGKSRWVDYLVIFLNGIFYYFSVLFLIFKSGHASYAWVFTAVLLALNVSAIFIADRFQKNYLRSPYIIFILFLVCMLFPLIAGKSMLILFLAPLTLGSLLYSKYTKTQSTILISAGSLLLIILVYLAYWIFSYSRAGIIGNILENKSLFIKGTWTSAVVLFTMVAGFNLMKHTETGISKKIFDRGSWLKFLKGALLVTVYLSLFWVYYYLVFSMTQNNGTKIMIWFSFNCLYLVFAIPYLGYQRSFYLGTILIAGIVLNMIYPALIHQEVTGFRNGYLQGDLLSLNLFLFHYICIIPLVFVLFIQQRFMRRAFPGMKVVIRGFYVYFSLFLIYLVLFEFEHLNLILATKQGAIISQTLHTIRRVPFSIILLISSLVILLLGFVRKSRFLRLYSLILLMIVLAKLLIYDSGAMSNTGRMILFFILGTILLFISFFYSKIRHFFGRTSGKSRVSGPLPGPSKISPPPPPHL